MRLLAIPMVLGVLVACDTTDAGFKLDTGIGDTGETSTNRIDTTPDTNGMGTQVGSEGFWGCPIEKIDPILDGSVDIATLGGSPDARASQMTGQWPLQIVDEGATGLVDGTLSLVNQRGYLWLDVADGPGCTDHLVAAVTATLAREASSQALVGLLAIAPSASRLIVSADESASLAAAWGPSPFPTTGTTFRLDTALDSATLDGKASYVDCDRLVVECATAQVVAEVDGSR